MSNGGRKRERERAGDEGAIEDLFCIAQVMAEVALPQEITEAYRLCRLTALRKNNAKVRGLNAADPFKRLVARTLAQQFSSEFREATAPYNFGIASHGGAESIIHYLRTITDASPGTCITKIDGIGAYDHIYRASMLTKLRALPTAHKLLPFVMASYGSQNTYIWNDESGHHHRIVQGEGGEQGDALMPA